MKKNIYKIIILFLPFSLVFASPVYFTHIPEAFSSLKKCNQVTSLQKTIEPKDKWENNSFAKIKISSGASAKERIESISCIRNSIAIHKKEDFTGLWRNYLNTFANMLSIDLHRYLALEDKMTFEDRVQVNLLFKEKQQLYNRLNSLTFEKITARKWKEKETEEELENIYYALLYNQLKFYSQISVEFRKYVY